MEFYDIVLDSCRFESGFEKRLGFKRIFIGDKDVKLTNMEIAKSADSGIVYGVNKERLASVAKGNVRGVCILDNKTDRKLMGQLSKEGITLCINLSAITGAFGLERPKRIYLTRKLVDYARKSRVEVAFLSLAPYTHYMLSAMQILELARLLGADEGYARKSMSEVGRRLIE